MILDLLRHGETLGPAGFRGRLDPPLSAEGWQQLRDATTDAAPWQLIVSSPLQRCAAFAQELAARHALPLQLEAGLREMDFGDWEGRTPAELMETDADALGRFWNDPWQYGPPGGETLPAMRQRVQACLAALHQQHAGRHLLLVTHGGVVRLLLAEARQLPPVGLLQVAAPHACRFRLQRTADGQLRECDPA